jgi:UDP-glucuronate 4-epimerase
MQNNILVTGGAGFIGSHLSGALLKKGNYVICVDNFNDYYNPKSKENNIKQYINNRNFKLYREDITDFKGLKRIFDENKIEGIIHLAARVGVRPSIKDPFIYEQVNLNGTLNLLELAKEYGIRKFIFGSSSSVYGGNKKIPFSEEDRVDNQISPYGFSKRAGELLCRTYHKLYRIKIVCLRFFTVYGPRGRPDMAIYKFTKLINDDKEIQVYGDGTSKRDYTFVSDVIKGIISSLEKDIEFDIINLGDSNPVKLNYIISLIEKNLGKKAKIKFADKQVGDMELTFADISKARKLLEYNPSIKIEEGIKKFVNWFLELNK